MVETHLTTMLSINLSLVLLAALLFFLSFGKMKEKPKTSLEADAEAPEQTGSVNSVWDGGGGGGEQKKIYLTTGIDCLKTEYKTGTCSDVEEQEGKEEEEKEEEKEVEKQKEEEN